MDQLAQRLQQERVRRGLSISELAQRTKIREPYILALESASYNVLPAVYVRSFIRTLGTELGIPAAELNRLVNLCIDGTEVSATPRHRPGSATHDSEHSSQRPAPSDPLGHLVSEIRSRLPTTNELPGFQALLKGRGRVVLIVVFILIIGLAYWISRRPSDTGVPNIPAEIVDVTSSEQDSLILTAVATDTAELTITMDGERSNKFIIFPGTDYRWSAVKRFTVSNIFNAGAIQFARDGSPLPVYGKRGEVLRELTISRTEVIASNSSVKMITAPADPERARRDSIADQRRRDSVRAERRKERLSRADELRRTSNRAKRIPANQPRQRRQQYVEPRITKTPPRSVR